MIKEEFYMTSKDQLEVHVYKWRPEDEANLKGVVQISHGMAETAVRYERFGEFLTQNGYVVYINDHRGHGKTAADPNKLGYLGKSNGFQRLIEDLKQLTDHIKSEYPHVPVFLFSHSMGSFAAQEYIMHYGEGIDGVILSGTNGKQGLMLDIGLMVAKHELKRLGPTAPSPRLDRLIFGGHNKKIKNARTKSDWLSRDEQEVDKYVKDPYCGTIFPASFFVDFMTELKYVEEKENVYKIPKNLPIYIFAGDKDPVGNYGKGIKKLYDTYQEAGLRHVSYKLYPEGRHEMLNETNRQEVMADTLIWLNKWSEKSQSTN